MMCDSSFVLTIAVLIIFEITVIVPFNCPKDFTRFEKILGVVPTASLDKKTFYTNNNGGPVTLECIMKCRKNETCAGFLLNYEMPACYFYETITDNDGQMSNEIDNNVAWFSKICIQGIPAKKLCNEEWIFERISGATLIGNDTKTLPRKITRETCQKSCLEEKSFSCRSIKFRNTKDKQGNMSLGTCTLSSADRHTMPFAYRASNYPDEYIDNSCATDNGKNFCSYEEYENSINRHADAKFLNQTKEECQKLCESESRFTCRGYSLLTVNSKQLDNMKRFTCFLHSEDSKIYGPSSLKYTDGGSYFERATCLNVTVTCTEKLMTVTFTPEMNFKGKLYLQGYSEDSECYSVGQGYRTVLLKIPLIAQHCGLTVARSKGINNRTLLSANMVLQYNPLIQTQGDRIIRVGCIFSNESKIVLGTSVNLTDNANNIGSSIINSSSFQPKVNLEVIDLFTQEEATDVQIGQELQLRIEVTPSNGSFDVRAGHLLAMTENGDESMLLLDDKGCPTLLYVFPSLQKFENATTKLLFANFQAFKFTSSPIVRFSIIVEFCPGKCPQINCENVPTSTYRKKRFLSLLETINGTTVQNIDRQQFHEQENQTLKMPLDFVIVVRNNKQLKPDKLLYGENKILIAGYDVINNEVCFDYSLLVGLLIAWILIQIILMTCSFLIIRKYKRHYEEEYVRQSIDEIQKSFRYGDSNLDSRRVHWADRRDNDLNYM